MSPSSVLPSGHQRYMVWGCSLCGLHGSFCCSRLTIVSGLVGMACPQSGWLPGPACAEAAGHWLVGLSQRLGAAGPWGFRGLALTLVGGPGFWSGWSCVRGPGCSISLLVGEASS